MVINKPLSGASVLEAATALVSQHGEAKTNMVDIGRALGVSHAALYRFYPSKLAVMAAIAKAAMHSDEVLASAWLEVEAPADERLLGMMMDLHSRRHERFATARGIHDLSCRILSERMDIIASHARHMTHLVARLISQGVDSREWKVDDIVIAAGVVCDAATVFVHPHFVAQASQSHAPVDARMRSMVQTLNRAFAAGPHDTGVRAP
jgi:AcrR family transcriptional regulator